MKSSLFLNIIWQRTGKPCLRASIDDLERSLGALASTYLGVIAARSVIAGVEAVGRRMLMNNNICARRGGDCECRHSVSVMSRCRYKHWKVEARLQEYEVAATPASLEGLIVLVQFSTFTPY